jgi:ParB family transcriptional regulator, chromosome partitioning protein
MSTVTERATTETRALRMLAAGDDHKVIAQTTGLTREDVQRLDSERPKPAARPAPQPTAARQGPPTQLPVRLLLEHPENVRTDLGDLTEMTDSVRAQGILQPLLVSPDGDGRYVVIAGHRRLAAAQAAGLDVVPVTVRRKNGSDAVAAMLVENLQRADLHPLDEANGYRRLIDEGGLTQAEVAKAVGVAQGRVSHRLALLNLTPAEQDALRRGDITTQAGYLSGRERGGRRMQGEQRRPKPRRVPHFTVQHALAEDAGGRCEHETTLKLGIACGPCWEQTIRDDERRRLARQAGEVPR